MGDQQQGTLRIALPGEVGLDGTADDRQAQAGQRPGRGIGGDAGLAGEYRVGLVIVVAEGDPLLAFRGTRHAGDDHVHLA
ncbi:hypothetical protein D3C77_650150 [compost metagenome]